MPLISEIHPWKNTIEVLKNSFDTQKMRSETVFLRYLILARRNTKSSIVKKWMEMSAVRPTGPSDGIITALPIDSVIYSFRASTGLKDRSGNHSIRPAFVNTRSTMQYRSDTDLAHAHLTN